MKKKILIILLMIISIISFTGCSNKKNNSNEAKKSDSLRFKEEYESLNGVEGKGGKINRTVSIPSDNPYEKVNAKTILEKIEKYNLTGE